MLKNDGIDGGAPGRNESPALIEYRRLVALLADRIRSVCDGYQTGCYVTGRAGIGKTHTVTSTLASSRVPHLVLNARITPAALFDAIEEYAQSVIVIDDVPILLANPQGAQLLMAATGGTPGSARVVTYSTKNNRRRTAFSGGIVAISNAPLAHDAAGQALASRLVLHHFNPSDEAIAAFLTQEAKLGVQGIPPAECITILDHVRVVCRDADFRLDLRSFYKSIADYRFWKAGNCATDWRILVEASMRQWTSAAPAAGAKTRAESRANDEAIVRELHARQLPKAELARVWKERTRKSLDTYYRRRRELRLT